MLVRLFIIFFILAFNTPTNASEIEVISPPGFDQKLVMVSGEIVDGDAAAFSEAVSGIDRATVVLRGPGGLVYEAFGIGAEINSRNFATMVAPETECYSACALIWLAGKRRYTSEEATIGVHAAFYEDDDASLSVSGAGNAEIGAYLALIGLRRDAIRYITTAEPDEGFLYLTPSISRALGIEVYEQDGLRTTTPSDAPTAPDIAYSVARLIAIESDCGILVGTGGRAQRAAEAVLERGHEVYGGEVFASLLPEAVEGVKAEVASDGRLAWCIRTTTAFIEDGFDFGIHGPSFECSRAETTNELMICRTPSLWVLDRVLATFYGAAREAWPEAKQGGLRADQTAWLQRRQSCGPDVGCTADLYHARIPELLR